MEDDDPSQQRQVVSRTQCSNCGTIKTPLWRRTPNGEIVCNACGLFLKARNTPRPVIVVPQQREQQNEEKHDNEISNSQNQSITRTQVTEEEGRGGSCPGDGHCNGTGGSASCDGCPAYNNQHQNKPFQCTNCSTRNSPLWRRDPENNIICNACGLYYKLHNFHRPITMKRTMIKRRKRSVPLIIDRIMTTDNNDVSKQQQEQQLNNNNIDLKNKIAELDAIINRLQRLRNEMFQQQQQQQQQSNNKSSTETAMVGINNITLDSLRDIVTKAEVTMLT